MFITMKKFKVRIALCHHIISASLLHKADPQHQADGEFPRKICDTEKNLGAENVWVLQATMSFCQRINRKELRW